MDGDKDKGPKLRPLAAANKAPNAYLANLVAQVAKAVGDNLSEFIGSEVISTEQLKKDIEDLNKELKASWRAECYMASRQAERRRKGTIPPVQKADSLVIFSMDVVALYPSIMRDMAQEAIAKAIERSNIKFEELNIKQLTRYVAMTRE